MDLALNNLQRLICHKTKPNQEKVALLSNEIDFVKNFIISLITNQLHFLKIFSLGSHALTKTLFPHLETVLEVSTDTSFSWIIIRSDFVHDYNTAKNVTTFVGFFIVQSCKNTLRKESNICS